jgi:precorrin-2/cobalt-factor-2 C20-methyltransferase
MSGKVYGIGLGPGDPELLSVKAHRLLSAARHVAFFRKAGRPGQARRLAGPLMPEGAVEHAMEYPVTTEIPVTDARYNDCLAAFYIDCVARLTALTDSGEDVVVLCEGDPFFYGSFMHLHARLGDRAEVVPGITGMSAAWTATGQPVTWGDDVLTVLMGTLDRETLADHMGRSDALVVMKIGRNLPKIRAALGDAGRLEGAWFVEYAAMPDQRVRRLSDVPEGEGAPYFSIVIVHGQGRRP